MLQFGSSIRKKTKDFDITELQSIYNMTWSIINKE